MKTEITPRAELEKYFALLPSLKKDIAELKQKWKDFYFGMIAPFKIFNVSKDDFIHYAKSFPEWEIEVKDGQLKMKCSVDKLQECLYLITNVDYELYETFVLKKSEEFAKAISNS
jgi:hypothetical protein